MDLIWTLIVGGVIGWLAGWIVKGGGFGILGDIVVGIVGAWLGGYLADRVGIAAKNSLGHYGIALAGAVILVILLRLLFGTKDKG